MRRNDDTKIAIDACMGNDTFSKEELADPDGAAKSIYAAWQDLVDRGEWSPLSFSEDDLADYIRWQAE